MIKQKDKAQICSNASQTVLSMYLGPCSQASLMPVQSVSPH